MKYLTVKDNGDILTADEAAKLLCLAPNTVRLMASANKLPHRRAGRKYIFYRPALMQWLAGGEGVPDS